MPATPEDKGAILVRLARAAIAEHFGQAETEPARPDWLDLPGATFVTLTQHGQLRGCIGSLEAVRPLGEDIEVNARASAFNDPRFPPLSKAELAATTVEVSVLSKPEPMQFTGRDDALRQLRPDIDGLVLEYGPHRATFLPQVWQQLPEPERFLSHLMLKAGLPAYFWSGDIKLLRYTVEKYQEAKA